VFTRRWGAHSSRASGRKEERTFRPDRVLPQYDRFIRRIADTCTAANLRCVFITQPTAYQPDVEPRLKNGFWMTPPNESYTLDFGSLTHLAKLYNAYLVETARARHQVVCDVAADLRATAENFRDDVHFTESGSRAVAKSLARCLAGHPDRFRDGRRFASAAR
jgi:lysophospholipase L1-like esterase